MADQAEFVRLEVADGVATIRLDRPKMNAISIQVQEELVAVVAEVVERDDVKAVVLTGGERVFAAGNDVKEMAEMSHTDMVKRSGPLQAAVTAVARIPKPVVAAVNGYALGGGCELALLCDMIFAADNARFGQPEVNLGVLPGIGGTQRLTRAVGKAKAMDMCLTGRQMDAAEAERAGLVARVFPAESLLEETLTAARVIAEKSLPATMMIKESVNRAFETTLAEGIRFERRVFHAVFATADQKEGMAAFSEKRKPEFTNR